MRLGKISIFSAIILLMAGQYIYAQPNPTFLGNAGSEVSGTYTITMKKMEISQDGTTFITVGEGDESFNMASGAAGASIGSYVSSSSIPVGTYTTFRATLSRTIIIKGQGGTPTYYTTTQNGTVDAGGTTFYKATTNSNQYEAVSFQVPADAEGEAGEVMEIIGDDMRVTKDFVNPIVIKSGETQTFAISFNTESMIGFETSGADYIFYPMSPEESAQ